MSSIYSCTNNAFRRLHWSSAVRKNLKAWLDHPRQTPLRRALFQVHLWCAIVIGLFVSMMGLTGACIVYKDALDLKLNPQLMQASGRLQVLPNAMLRSAQDVHPGWNVLLLDTGTQPAWAFYLSPSGWTPASKVDVVFVDPATGNVRGHRASNGGLMNGLMNLHINLLSGDIGNKVVGVLGCVVFMVAVTGLIIWWPGRKRWRNSLKINVHARWPRLNWDLHNSIGFFAGLPLALQTITALSFIFPMLVVPPLVTALHGNIAEIRDFQATGHSHSSKGGKASGELDVIIAESAQRYPTMQLKAVTFPLAEDDTYQVNMGGAHFDDRGSQAKLLFDRYTGECLSAIDTARQPLALRAFVALGPWHFGHIAGTLSHLLWMCLGLCPAALFPTGFYMWWRRVLAPRWRERRSETH